MSIEPTGGVIPEFTRGDRLRKARTLTGLNSRDFAERIGVSQKTVTDAEGDKRETRKIVINAWAMATGVPREWLETGNAPQPDNGPGGVSEAKLPHLDSNQEPSGSATRRVIPLRRVA